MSATLDTLKLRRPRLNYVAPPICEIVFSTTATPTIVLEDLTRLLPPSGFVLGGVSGFRLSWNAYPGALCFNVYSVSGTTYTLVFECVTDTFVELPGPGTYVVTVITVDGESDVNLSQRIDATTAGPAPTMTVVADQPETYEVDDTPGLFRFIRNGPLAGNFFCRFTLTGTATVGALNDYTLTPSTTLNNVGGNVWEILMPDSVSEVFLTVDANVDASVESDETVIVTIQATSNYAVGTPDTATVTIKEGCKPESGTFTPCDLSTPDDTNLGTISIPSGPSGLVTLPWGTFPLGDYEAIYEGGAYKFNGNPDPGEFRIQQYKALFPGSSATYWDQFGTCNDPTVAGVEACVPIGKQIADVFIEGQISLQFDGLGTAPDYPGGGVDPTFRLHRSALYPVMPARVRIKNFDESQFDVCANSVASANPSWDGTMPSRQLLSPTAFFWQENNPSNFSINGQELSFARVDFFTSMPPPGSGCGWRIFLEVAKTIAPFFQSIWVGYKRIGDTPQGIYYRASGCSTGPECLVVEEY